VSAIVKTSPLIIAVTARRHLRRLIVLIVVLVIGLTALGSVALLLLSRQVAALDAEIAPAEAANAQVLQSMTDAESGLRGFLITKDPTFLQPFDSGLSKLNIAQLQIDASLADQPSLLALARAEHRSAEAWLHDFARPLGAQRAAPPTVGLAAQRAAKQQFDTFRSDNASLTTALRQSRADVLTTTRRTTTVTAAMLLVGAILGLAVAVPLARRIIRGVAPPLMALSAVVRRWRDGDRSATADEDTGVQEVRDVARGFNALTRENSSALAEVAERNRLAETVGTIARDVGETLAADEVTSRIIGPVFRAMSADAIWLRILPGAQVSGPGVEAYLPDTDPRMKAPPALISMAGDLATELWQRQGTLRLPAGEERSPSVVKSETFAAILEMSGRVGISSIVVVPLGAGAECVGYLILGRAATSKPWSVPETDALGQMGRDIGRAIVHARTFEREQQAVQKVLALDLQKSDFVSMISHELRTPLTSISGYLELIRDGDTGVVPPKVTELLAVVERNTFRLRQLIDDLLILSNIESRTLRSEQLPVDLHQICQEARTVAAAQAASRQIGVTFESRLDPVTVRGDREQLEQVISNLLDNAVKFSRTGGRVQLRLTADGNSAVVVCADDGIGIPAAEKDQLGTRFFRASNATAKAVQGTGLGLAIVRRILDQHGGSINIESVEGNGTTAEVRIPLASTRSGPPRRMRDGRSL